MADYKNISYLGFSFNGVHSSDFKLYRASQGDRYTTNINGNYEDKTKHIKGQQGVYYFGTILKDLKIQIPVAFDNVNDEELSGLTEWCNNGLIGELVLDEAPYKAYWARFDGVQNMSTICFDKNGKNVYKGEITFNFICYEPYAHSTFKYLNDYKYLYNGQHEEMPGSEVSEWQNSVNLLENSTNLDTLISTSTIMYKRVYNPGDYTVYPIYYFKITGQEDFRTIRVKQRINKIEDGENKLRDASQLIIDGGNFGSEEAPIYGFEAGVPYEFVLDSKTKTIQCLTNGTYIKKGNINNKIFSWNNYKTGFELLPQETYSGNNRFEIAIFNSTSQLSGDFINLADDKAIDIRYNYYYK